MIFQIFPNTNVWEHKFDVVVKESKVILEIIIWIHLVDLESSMLYTKTQP